MTQLESLRTWIGRSESRTETLSPEPVIGLAATLDLDGDALVRGPLPPLWHWLYFLPRAPQRELGQDGHPALGGFMPPVPPPAPIVWMSTDGKASVGGATGRWEGSSDCLATAAASTTRRAATRFASRDSLPEEVAPFSAAPSTTKMRRTSTTVRRTVRSAVRNRDSTSLAHAEPPVADAPGGREAEAAAPFL